MDDAPDFGLDVGGRQFDLMQLEDELRTAGVVFNGLVLHGPSRIDPLPPGTPPDPVWPAGTRLYTHTTDGTAVALPPEATTIVNAHKPAGAS